MTPDPLHFLVRPHCDRKYFPSADTAAGRGDEASRRLGFLALGPLLLRLRSRLLPRRIVGVQRMLILIGTKPLSKPIPPPCGLPATETMRHSQPFDEHDGNISVAPGIAGRRSCFDAIARRVNVPYPSLWRWAASQWLCSLERRNWSSTRSSCSRYSWRQCCSTPLTTHPCATFARTGFRSRALSSPQLASRRWQSHGQCMRSCRACRGRLPLH